MYLRNVPVLKSNQHSVLLLFFSLFLHVASLCAVMKTYCVRGWRCSSAWLFFQKNWFDSQHPHGSFQTPVTPDPKDLASSSVLVGTRHAQGEKTHMQMKYPYKHTNFCVFKSCGIQCFPPLFSETYIVSH